MPDAFAGALEELLATEATNSSDATKFFDLSKGEEELREAFNSDRGHVRLILILSPT